MRRASDFDNRGGNGTCPFSKELSAARSGIKVGVSTCHAKLLGGSREKGNSDIRFDDGLALSADPSRLGEGEGLGWTWGKEDEVGALNAVKSPAAVLRALRQVKTGKVYDLGVRRRSDLVQVAGAFAHPDHVLSQPGGCETGEGYCSLLPKARSRLPFIARAVHLRQCWNPDRRAGTHHHRCRQSLVQRLSGAGLRRLTSASARPTPTRYRR